MRGRELTVKIADHPDDPKKDQISFLVDMPDDPTNQELAFVKWLAGEVVDRAGYSCELSAELHKLE